MTPLPPTLQTTYANLLQAHLNRPSFEFEGAPFMRKLSGRTYWYANHRVAPGAPQKQRYLGPDTEDMRARIAGMQANRQSHVDFRQSASGLVAQLRAGGISGPSRKTGPMLRTLTNSGVFRLGGTLIGAHAFRHYDLTLGVHLSEGSGWTNQTDDIDSAGFERLSMAIEDSADPDLVEGLSRLGFRPKPAIGRKPSTSWTLPEASYAIDFLTPSFDDEEASVPLKAMKVWAQSSHFLNYLIAEPVDAVTPYMEGLLIKIPRPERFAIHKLIISQHRKGARTTPRKDIEQARTLIWAMAEDQPYVLEEAIRDADSRGARWREALDHALTLEISPDDPIRPGDSAEFSGRALNGPVRLRISGSVLTELFGGDSLQTAKANRGRIEGMFRQLFRKSPSSDVLLASYNLPAS